ncbi:MAG: hypothetical protein DHS80DRAFT_25657 [Piptocephalis tieghemiana]|nr:MAG: hypothetical protein DHS80DRAFT_25657 [Piptocephalis tieghemiana]
MQVSNNPFLLTLATVAGPQSAPLQPMAPLEVSESDPRHVMEPLPAPVTPRARRSAAYIPPGLRTRALGRREMERAASTAPPSPSITPVTPKMETKTPATRAPSPPTTRSASPTSPAHFRPGTTLTSVREVVACLRRYEHLSGLFDSQVLPVTPIEPKVHVRVTILELVCFMLRQRLGDERVRDGAINLGAPARILLDSGKVLLLHPISD